ncbi:helix-turn-helix domain-containing protein [Kiloniella antarctica]|uniref:Helix-turn-helix domain-containing protein n=1 Tax=Kiloniella antarctica TaxID=1550907 RepID=A0ABW5BIK3_9PROT
MARQKNDQIPLGELLTMARLEKGLSRAQLAKETNVSENSIVRYEKAGLEKDGQYPPSQKLAALCFCLGISPLTALLSSLERDDYWMYYGETDQEWLMSHPAHSYLSEQWFALTRDNQLLREMLKVFLCPEKAAENFHEDDIEWMKEEARKVIEVQDKFESKMIDLGLFSPTQRTLSTPGDPTKVTRKGFEKDPFDYASMSNDYTGTKNGSD